MQRLVQTLICLSIPVAVTLIAKVDAAEPGGIDFNRDIRPILSNHCFACHGPDEEQLEADLRLDARSGLFRETDDIHIVVPGQPDESELLRRISSKDLDDQMPPKKFGRPLKPEQIDLIRRWIESGAEWKQHWSFISPKRPADPEVSQPDWIANGIDRFVLARLDQEQLKPSPAADRRTLIRRVTLDLTGLPPTPKEVDAFVNDKSDNAYENVVDRLLKSPRYAERMAIRWLDYARYADTSGYQSDGPRDMWRWRDWVIEAFHRNKPFDEFTVEQLAGDMMTDDRALAWRLDASADPDAAFDTIRRHVNLRIASAFNRNHRGNAEGGIVPEEFQVEYVVDRVDTTFAVWQGLTIGCGRCHSHKYDPISQKEYYQVFSYFNNIPENGRALKEGNSPPWMVAPTDSQLREAVALSRDARKHWKEKTIELDERTQPEGFRRWRKAISRYLKKNDTSDWTIEDGLVAAYTLDGSLKNSASPEDSSGSDSPVKTQIVNAGEELWGEGVHGTSLHCDGKRYADVGDVAKFGYMDAFSLGARVYINAHKSGTILSRMEPIDRGAGFNLHVTDKGTVQLNLVKRWLDDSLRVETVEPIPTGRWVHVFATYDGSRVSGEWPRLEPGRNRPDWQMADGITIYIDGERAEKRVNLDGINQSFTVEEPLRIGAGMSNFHGLVDDVRVYDRKLDNPEVRVVASHESIEELHDRIDTHKKAAEAHDAGALKYWFFAEQFAGPPQEVAHFREVRANQQKINKWYASVPKLMVMEESAVPRATHVLRRGQYNNPGERVEPGVPAALLPMPDNAAPNRLGLAWWLVQPDNPLTSRVTVNRFWRDLFGTGIVKTVEDFGAQGERPTHPQLLDWLAVKFVDSGWDVKHIIKTMVMSSTYRQSSRVTHELYTRDPDNRLLARGPRFRLPAEAIRDQALLVSGLLTERLGGPSVKPYQPAGLWEEIATDKAYEQSKGPDLYRRSLYTYWKRTVAPPMMSSFDAAGREMCQVGLTRTNTPLQALNLLNDVTFVEAARVLAQNLLEEPHTSHQQRLDDAFQRVLARKPTDKESAILLASLRIYRDHFQTDVQATMNLINAGDAPSAVDGALAEMAAWTTICSTILNLDEVVTRQ